MNNSATVVSKIEHSPKSVMIRRVKVKSNRSLKDLLCKPKETSLGPFEDPSFKKHIRPLNLSQLKLKAFNVKTTGSTRKQFEPLSSARSITKLNNMNVTQVLSKTTSNQSLKKCFTMVSSSVISPKAVFPMTPRVALTEHADELYPNEKGEILDYPEIYYLARKDCRDDPPMFTHNKGYDDDKGDYCLYRGDHIAYRYEILNILGKGSFGQVCLCFDNKRKEQVAIKVIKNKKRFHQQAGFEIKILQTLLENDPEDAKNVVKVKNYFLFRNHICITFELLQINLYQLLQRNHLKGLSLKLIKKIAIQILVALQYLGENDIIHCDLKPENILLTKKDSAYIKIIDFGSSCFEDEKIHTYIQSRFYRAPEIILGIRYTSAIDMWSLGCILVELFTGKPIFPGRNEEEQFTYIMEVLGAPPKSLVSQITRNSSFFYQSGEPKLLTDTKGLLRTPGIKPISEILRGSTPNFINFIQRCFEWNPITRMTAVQGLEHA